MRFRRPPDQPSPWAFFADFPRILPYLTELVSAKFRYDHGYAIFMRRGGAKHRLHGGNTPYDPGPPVNVEAAPPPPPPPPPAPTPAYAPAPETVVMQAPEPPAAPVVPVIPVGSPRSTVRRGAEGRNPGVDTDSHRRRPFTLASCQATDS